MGAAEMAMAVAEMAVAEMAVAEMAVAEMAVATVAAIAMAMSPRHTAHLRHFHTVTRLPLFQLVQQQLRTSSAASGQQSSNEVQRSSQKQEPGAGPPQKPKHPSPSRHCSHPHTAHTQN